MNLAEKERLLRDRAKRKLNAAGYHLKAQGGGFLVLNAETGRVYTHFESIQRLGKAFGLWGDTAVADRDSEGRDTPETAAIRERARKNAPSPPSLPRPSTAGPSRGKEVREAHRR